MKILHIASFDGNIGDNASHMGFRNIFTDVISSGYSVDQLEIRKFYNNYSLPDKQRFDEDFAALANKYDLLFIGGGGFLDFDIKGSVTGTTIGILPEILEKIKTPMIISSIGSNPRNEVPDGNLEKFRSFLDSYLDKSNRFLAVRNDGSHQVLKEVVGDKYYQAIPEVLDHGFFYTNNGSFYKPTEKEYIIINTTSDQVQMKNRNIGTVNADNYIDEMGKVINHIINDTSYDLVFAPHIYSDFAAINALVKNVNDFHMRTRVVITPYVQGNYGANQIFSAYKNSAVALGMRFHANVCTIAMHSKSIGLGALDRVASMYDSVGLSGQYVTVDKPFGDELIGKIQSTIESGNPRAEILAQRQAETKQYYKDILQNII